MSRVPKSLNDGIQLLQISALITKHTQTVIEEWAREQQEGASNDGASPDILPSQSLYQAQRALLALTGTLTELITDPSLRIMEVGCQYWESRALFIACERRIPDLLAAPGVDSSIGLSAQQLGEMTGIEHLKLSRILRTLCSSHIFAETASERFANNIISTALVNNEPLRAYVVNFGLDLYAASEHLPKALLDKVKGPSYKVTETAWQDAMGTDKSRWDWLEEKVLPGDFSTGGATYPSVPQQEKSTKSSNMKEQALVNRPEHKIFNLSMLGGGRVHGAAHPYGQYEVVVLSSLTLFVLGRSVMYRQSQAGVFVCSLTESTDYPWSELGSATVVDVGGGVGKSPQHFVVNPFPICRTLSADGRVPLSHKRWIPHPTITSLPFA